jgi:two-component system, NtrC family, sensor histidine kinase HydH
MAETKRGFPLWVSNLLIFMLLSAAIVVHFLWQIHQAKQDFIDHVRAHVNQVAEVIQLSARGAVLSQKVAEEILESLLENTARFVDYLDQVEPFAPEELAAFAKESGLAGIGVFKGAGDYTEGPPRWLRASPEPCRKTGGLEHRAAEGMYLFSWPRKGDGGCVVLGIEDKRIAALQTHLGLDNTIKTMAELPGIVYVKMEAPSTPEATPGSRHPIAISKIGNAQVAETRIAVGHRELAVGVDAGYLASSIDRLWRDFFIFGTAFVVLGIFFSFVLYLQQSSYLSQAKSFERRISKEREDASLGRAAAAIAHEIRNPLNALGMGLQRLQLEGGNLSGEHSRLVSLMLEAIRRADASVGSLLKYARPQTPRLSLVRLDGALTKALELYLSRCNDLGISIVRNIDCDASVRADPDLLCQAIENLLKNAVEAQPKGGFLRIDLRREGNEIALKVSNGGFLLSSHDAERILEPYFTTKTDGTGLGVNISQRIVQMHGGRMQVGMPETGTVEISMYLPLNEDADKTHLVG